MYFETILTTQVAGFFAVYIHKTRIGSALTNSSPICAISGAAFLTLTCACAWCWTSITRFLAINFHVSWVLSALASLSPTGTVDIGIGALRICSLRTRLTWTNVTRFPTINFHIWWTFSALASLSPTGTVNAIVIAIGRLKIYLKVLLKLHLYILNYNCVLNEWRNLVVQAS